MDKFLIAPINSGLKTDRVPFMIPEDAFQRLENMIIYEGAIRRRPPSLSLDINDARSLTSRLRINIGTTNAVTGNLPATVVPGTAALGQQFSVGATIFTVYQNNGAMHVSPAGATGTFNVGTKTVTITGATPSTTVYWYPSQPVLGFATYLTNTGGNVAGKIEFAFDQQFAYKYDLTTGCWERVTGGAGLFSASALRRFSWTNFQGQVSGESNLIVTNFVDNIRYYNDTTPTFTNLIPATLGAANYNVQRCKFVIPFRDRLFFSIRLSMKVLL